MATNAEGVPSPEITDSPDVPRDILALVNAVGPILVPKFSTITQRDSAYSTIPFSMCRVGDIYYRRVGAVWQQIGGLNWGAAQASRTADENTNDGVWKALGMSSTDYVEGSGLTVGPTGIGCGFTGRVQCTGQFKINIGGAGRRAIGIGIDTQTLRNDQQWNGTGMTLSLSGELNVTTGQILKLWALQTGTSVVLVTDRFLQVRRVA